MNQTIWVRKAKQNFTEFKVIHAERKKEPKITLIPMPLNLYIYLNGVDLKYKTTFPRFL